MANIYKSNEVMSEVDDEEEERGYGAGRPCWASQSTRAEGH